MSDITAKDADHSKKVMTDLDFLSKANDHAENYSTLVATDKSQNVTILLHVTAITEIVKDEDGKSKVQTRNINADYEFRELWLEVFDAIVRSRNELVDRKRPTAKAIASKRLEPPAVDTDPKRNLGPLRFDYYEGTVKRPLAKLQNPKATSCKNIKSK